MPRGPEFHQTAAVVMVCALLVVLFLALWAAASEKGQGAAVWFILAFVALLWSLLGRR